jgi:hypothetical protein
MATSNTALVATNPQQQTALAPISAATIEQVAVHGDLAKLQPAQRLEYYAHLCESLGLNPLTRPFQYITLQNKLTLYATRDCSEQLRSKHRVSIEIVDRETEAGLYIVTARATLPNGRTDEAQGIVAVDGLKGQALGDARMKAETKAKRRVTLSIAGLGFLDESEIHSVQGARIIDVDPETGEIKPNPATADQLRRIHIKYRDDLKWTNDQYREAVTNTFHVDSSKKLTDVQAEAFLRVLTAEANAAAIEKRPARAPSELPGLRDLGWPRSTADDDEDAIEGEFVEPSAVGEEPTNGEQPSLLGTDMPTLDDELAYTEALRDVETLNAEGANIELVDCERDGETTGAELREKTARLKKRVDAAVQKRQAARR